jgi:hypothetical protein
VAATRFIGVLLRTVSDKRRRFARCFANCGRDNDSPTVSVSIPSDRLLRDGERGDVTAEISAALHRIASYENVMMGADARKHRNAGGGISFKHLTVNELSFWREIKARTSEETPSG